MGVYRFVMSWITTNSQNVISLDIRMSLDSILGIQWRSYWNMWANAAHWKPAITWFNVQIIRNKQQKYWIMRCIMSRIAMLSNIRNYAHGFAVLCFHGFLSAVVALMWFIHPNYSAYGGHGEDIGYAMTKFELHKKDARTECTTLIWESTGLNERWVLFFQCRK